MSVMNQAFSLGCGGPRGCREPSDWQADSWAWSEHSIAQRKTRHDHDPRAPVITQFELQQLAELREHRQRIDG
jgi:hypothetical protein